MLSAVALFCVRRNRETLLVLLLNAALVEFWMFMLIYIAKKGGIGTELETLLYGTHAVRVKLQYLMFTLDKLGYLLAIGRYLFPLAATGLAAYYCKRLKKTGRWIVMGISALVTAVLLTVYAPGVFEAIITRSRGMMNVLVTGSLMAVCAQNVAALVLLTMEYRDITMPFYKHKFIGQAVTVISLMMLYMLYAPQDPAQVYLFYRNEFISSSQGLWYLSPSFSLFNYTAVFVLVMVCTAAGIYVQLKYMKDTITSDQNEIAISRKFDAASKGASVFVHSVKNQLLANRVLLKRMGAMMAQP